MIGIQVAADARVITAEKKLAMYYLSLANLSGDFSAAANWVMGPVKSYLNASGLEADECSVSPEILAQVMKQIGEGTLNFNNASKMVFPALIENSHLSVQDHIERLGLVNENHDDELALIVDEVIVQ